MSAADERPPPRPRSDSASDRAVEEERLTEIMDVLIAFAARGPRKVASVGDGTHTLDAIAAGLNMVGEELERREKLEASYQKRLIEAERAAAVGELAAGVAHEINNPVAFVLTNLEALQEHVEHLDLVLRELSETTHRERGVAEELERSRAVEVLRESRAITSEAIAGLLRVSRIVADMQSFQPSQSPFVEDLDLNDVAERACALIGRQLAYRARLIRSFGRLPVIQGDRSRLTQVITQLLVGAMHAIDEGDPANNTVVVATERVGDRISVSVRDTGRARAWPALSLAFANDVLRAHGGSIRWASDEKGTTFNLDLPLRTTFAEAAPPPPASLGTRRIRVLVIDDEEAILRAYSRILSQRVELVVAQSGRDAIALLERDPAWDAILCDLMMPDVDGVAVFGWVSEHHPALADRIVFCTGGAFTPRANEFLSQMRERVLLKPIVKAKLLAALERLCGSIERAPDDG